MGEGRPTVLMEAFVDTEIGTAIGSLPQGLSQTAIQNDFYHALRTLKLQRYNTLTANLLELDLREKTTVKTEASAFLDLRRSMFLHRLRDARRSVWHAAAGNSGPRRLEGKLGFEVEQYGGDHVD